MKKVISTFLAVCLAAPAFGGPQPWIEPHWVWSFDLKRQAWHATDILVVNEGEEIDGMVTVEEVLHGSKTVGEKLEFPGLAKLADPKARSTFAQEAAAQGPRLVLPDGAIEGQKMEVLSGKRMFLFLGGGGEAVDLRAVSGTMERPAPLPEDLQHPISRNVALIEGERVFAGGGRLDAPTNPFRDLGLSMPEARKLIEGILSDRARVQRCAKIDEPERRESPCPSLL